MVKKEIFMHEIKFDFFLHLMEFSKDQLSRRIYITNLSSFVDTADLRKIFKELGVVLDVKIVKTISTNEPTGLGYVELGNQFDIGRAFRELNGIKIKGCYINLFDKRYGPGRRMISDRRQNTERRMKETPNLLQLNEITSGFIALENQEQVERRGDIDRRIVGNRRNRIDRRDYCVKKKSESHKDVGEKK